jgi:hypothetical protein
LFEWPAAGAPDVIGVCQRELPGGSIITAAGLRDRLRAIWRLSKLRMVERTG